MSGNKEIKTNNTTTKNFSYSKGEVSLSFSLRLDHERQLEDFKEILEVALKEVTEDISK